MIIPAIVFTVICIYFLWEPLRDGIPAMFHILKEEFPVKAFFITLCIFTALVCWVIVFTGP